MNERFNANENSPKPGDIFEIDGDVFVVNENGLADKIENKEIANILPTYSAEKPPMGELNISYRVSAPLHDFMRFTSQNDSVIATTKGVVVNNSRSGSYFDQPTCEDGSHIASTKPPSVPMTDYKTEEPRDIEDQEAPPDVSYKDRANRLVVIGAGAAALLLVLIPALTVSGGDAAKECAKNGLPNIAAIAGCEINYYVGAYGIPKIFPDTGEHKK